MAIRLVDVYTTYLSVFLVRIAIRMVPEANSRVNTGRSHNIKSEITSQSNNYLAKTKGAASNVREVLYIISG